MRASLDNGDVERTKVSAGRGSAIAGSNASIVIGTGNRLLRWDTAVHEVARFDKPIKRVVMRDAGVIAVLADNEYPAGRQGRHGASVASDRVAPTGRDDVDGDHTRRARRE